MRRVDSSHSTVSHYQFVSINVADHQTTEWRLRRRTVATHSFERCLPRQRYHSPLAHRLTSLIDWWTLYISRCMTEWAICISIIACVKSKTCFVNRILPNKCIFNAKQNHSCSDVIVINSTIMSYTYVARLGYLARLTSQTAREIAQSDKQSAITPSAARLYACMVQSITCKDSYPKWYIRSMYRDGRKTPVYVFIPVSNRHTKTVQVEHKLIIWPSTVTKPSKSLSNFFADMKSEHYFAAIGRNQHFLHT